MAAKKKDSKVKVNREIEKGSGKKTSGRMESFWLDTVPGRQFDRLSEDIRVDTVIVGAGIAGLSVAYMLCKAGEQVAVLEDGFVGSGETGRTTAHLVNALDDRYYDLEKNFGEEKMRLALQSHTAAVDKIEEIVRQERVECDFERLNGYLFLDPSDKRESLDKELEALHRAGLTDAVILDRAPVESFNTGPCIQFPRQAQFHPMKYLNALADSIIRYGGRIYTQTHVEKFDKNTVRTSNGNAVHADSIVVATNTPINDRVAIHTKQAPYRTYVVGARVPKDSLHRSLLWDTGDQTKPHAPYHYVRLQNVNDDSDLLIVGGGDHKTAQREDQEARYAALEKWTTQNFPISQEFTYRWSGQVMEPVDGLAYIGRNPMDDENVYICTGDSGNGMTHGTIAGMLISDLILGKENPWTDLYNPSRVTLRAATDYMRENLNVAAQYVDWIKEGEISSFEELKPAEGGVIKDGLKAYAVYRDPDGILYAVSAVCTHLACIVHWNSAEKTFDCPCHGSRFTARGEVVNGPATRNLEPVKFEEVEDLTKISKSK